jgi:hypothetical protein
VQVLELKLDITQRWEPEGEEWQRTGRLVAMRKYQRALDVLEGLIVARMFELTKMNRSQTGTVTPFCDIAFRCAQPRFSGYAMRKHIGKALQARSPAIRTALERYNTAALALNPPRRTLQWKEVVEYAFLADFDLLRDARQNISHRVWATPAGRLAMDHYFKICRAKEEISRLNVEIRRVATYLRDEDRYLCTCENQVREFNPQLAHQVALHRMERGRFNAHHLRRLTQISQLSGFTGSILPGESIDTGPGASASNPTIQPPVIVHHDVEQGVMHVEEDTVEDLEEDQGADDSDEEISRAIYDLLRISDT